MIPSHALRPAEPGDRGYVLQTWLESYRQSPWAHQLPEFAYWSRFGHVGLVEDVAFRSPVVVACLPETPSFIYGWCCHSAVPPEPVLHYMFVRHEFRRQGFGRLLWEAAQRPLRISHVTPDGSRMLSGLGVNPEFVNLYRGEKR